MSPTHTHIHIHTHTRSTVEKIAAGKYGVVVIKAAERPMHSWPLWTRANGRIIEDSSVCTSNSRIVVAVRVDIFTMYSVLRPCQFLVGSTTCWTLVRVVSQYHSCHIDGTVATEPPICLNRLRSNLTDHIRSRYRLSILCTLYNLGCVLVHSKEMMGYSRFHHVLLSPDFCIRNREFSSSEFNRLSNSSHWQEKISRNY